MNIEDLKSKWQSHDHGIPLKIDASLLLNEVRRNHRHFELQLWRRDVSEVAASALITVVFATLGILTREWSLFLCAAGSLFVGLFFIKDRLKQRRKREGADESLRATLELSLAQVEHQIWLLRGVLWWYLLPLIPGLIALLASASWQSRGHGLAEQLVIVGVAVVCGVAFWQTYRINQRAIQKTLEPRRMELEEIRTSLDDQV